MSGLYYAIFCVSVLAIIWWCVRSDRGSGSDGASGILAIRERKIKASGSDASRP